MKKNREKLGMECRSLLQRRSSLKNEILQLQEYLNILSVSNLYQALLVYDIISVLLVIFSIRIHSSVAKNYK